MKNLKTFDNMNGTSENVIKIWTVVPYYNTYDGKEVDSNSLKSFKSSEAAQDYYYQIERGYPVVDIFTNELV